MDLFQTLLLKNETSFELLSSLFSWYQTWIGVKNIETLNPEGWFQKGHGMKVGKKIDDGIWMP